MWHADSANDRICRAHLLVRMSAGSRPTVLCAPASRIPVAHVLAPGPSLEPDLAAALLDNRDERIRENLGVPDGCGAQNGRVPVQSRQPTPQDHVFAPYSGVIVDITTIFVGRQQTVAPAATIDPPARGKFANCGSHRRSA
jgi:hypothetical protein